MKPPHGCVWRWCDAPFPDREEEPLMRSQARARRLTAALRLLVLALGVALLVDPSAAVAASPTSAVGPAETPWYIVWHGSSSHPTACLSEQVCLWNDDDYKGDGIFFAGDYKPCEGWRFEGTVWQDRTWSIRNLASGPISIWNRHSDGSYNYDKYGWLASGYSWPTQFSHIMNAWVYDPGNNCTSLNLHVVPPPKG
jgi:hypothetical protein